MPILETPCTPNWQGLRECILQRRTPDRVYHIELFLDPEVQDQIAARFGLLDGLTPNDPAFPFQKEIRIQSFLGYDYVRCSLDRQEWPLKRLLAQDTAALSRLEGRSFVDEHIGPITDWESFEAYPWPEAEKASTRAIDYYSEHLPENMCIIGSGGFAHFAEHLTWLMGYETCCMALFEQRDLVQAIAERLYEYYDVFLRRLLQYERVKLVWGSDDMGFKNGLLISPADMREFVLHGHKHMASLSHEAGLPYLLHSCGNLSMIMDELIDDVKIDAKHSFEDTIEDVIESKARYGDRIAMLGGIDVDFLCRADEKAVRARVRKTLDAAFEGGGYVLGTGNSVANYIPLDNYLAMLDEGRRYGGGVSKKEP